MTWREAVAAGGVVVALMGAGISYGRVQAALEDAQGEIRLLRADMAAINGHLIEWIAAHRD